MDRRPGQGRVDEIRARAELMLVDVLPHLVEARAPVQSQLRGQLPLVLQIDAGEIADPIARIGEAERPAGGVAIGVTARLHRRGGPHDALLHARIESEAERVGVVYLVGVVSLQAVHERAAVDVRGDAVEQDVAVEVGHEQHAVVTREVGELHVDIAERFLPGEHAIGALFVLDLIDLGGIAAVGGGAVDRKQAGKRLLAGIGRDLILDGLGAGDRADARRLVEEGRGVAEEAAARIEVMERGGVRGRISRGRGNSGIRGPRRNTRYCRPGRRIRTSA